MHVSVIGCGYLGTTHAACMAELGHEVVGVESDPEKLALLQQGAVPFYEPALEELLQANMGAGRLRFTDSLAEAAAFGDVHFVCVGTPQLPESLGADLTQVDDAIESLGPHLRDGALVVGKSTVPVGTAAGLARHLARLAPADASVELAWNPEFLREGFAVADTLAPDRLVFGVTSGRAEQTLREVYVSAIDAGSPVVVTDLATAEMVKTAANAFLATKISFINAIAEMCEVAGADVVDLADAIGYDDRIGRKFLNAGIGFGGGCLPKDIRAFLHRAGELGVGDAMSFLREVDAINLHQRQKMVEQVGAVAGEIDGLRVGVLGAAFKPDSDDVRDSPALWIAGQLHLHGAVVTVYDPRAMPGAAARYPTLRYAATALAACEDADVVLHLTEWEEFRDLDPADVAQVVAHPRIIDGRNRLDRESWRSAGWTVHSPGRA